MTIVFLRSVLSSEIKDGSSDHPVYQLSIKAKLNTGKSKLTDEKRHTEYLTNIGYIPHHQTFTKISKEYPLEEMYFDSFSC